MSAHARELIRASAGSGKTFTLSSRIIGLLAAGEEPAEIFASTFTRKAAGEILERVLVRLARAAMSDDEATELAGHAVADPAARAECDPAFWRGVLHRTVKELHRLDVGTLDAFFARVVRAFGYELELPPRWGIADDPTADRLRAEALQEVLDELDPAARIELVRGLAGGSTRRSIQDAILNELDDILRADEARDPEAPGWRAMDAPAEDRPDHLDARCEELVRGLAEAPVPRTKAGDPSKPWLNAVDGCIEAIEDRDWASLVGMTLFQRALEDPPGEYYRTPVPPTLAERLREAGAVARAELAHEYALRAAAMGRLAALYGRAYRRRVQSAGALRFEDVTRLLAGEALLGARDDLFYRLDGDTRHLLLDEFQDTSLLQWNALQPLADTLLGGPATGERPAAGGAGGAEEDGGDGPGAAVIVADPKQSIYGWRGAAPIIVDHVGHRYALTDRTLARSYRSSAVVLDAVNRIFQDVEDRWVFESSEVDREVARDWARSFTEHEPARELPGHVTLRVGPRDPGRGTDRPLLMEHVADYVADLHRTAPEHGIGVLTRTNKAVGRLILELRSRGVDASEEGGTALTDSAAVASVLALFRLADHPSDTLAAYHVAGTPVGAAVGLSAPGDARAAEALAARFRRRLLEDGYGPTLAGLAGDLEAACSARERVRLQQLVELGYRYDGAAELRVDAFVRLVEATRAETPGTGRVRVMTVHQAKGLEFDAVVLPELDASMTGGGGGGAPLVRREAGTGPVTHIYPYMSEDIRQLFDHVPELQEAYTQSRAAEVRDALSVLYVGVTRARHALHMVIAADSERGHGTARSHARLIREALAPNTLEKGERIDEGDTLFETGDRDWYRSVARDEGRRAPAAVIPDRIRLREGPRTRGLERRAPSAGEERAAIDLRAVLGADADRGALDRGSLVHAWLEDVDWIEDGLPDSHRLHAIARDLAAAPVAEATEIAAWLEERLAVREIRDRLSRDRYAGQATVVNELPFLRREGDRLVEGIIDRLVLVREDGELVRAEVLDYKTDAIDPGDEAALRLRAEHHGPQLRAYRRAVAELYGLDLDRVTAALVFLKPGRVVEVTGA